MAMSKLNDHEMDQVVGGFQEQNKGLPTNGMNIECPNCHSKEANSFAGSALYSPQIGSVEYHCKCGCQFVCYKDKVILKDDWLALCKNKGLAYEFK